jgi:hypothetical protein
MLPFASQVSVEEALAVTVSAFVFVFVVGTASVADTFARLAFDGTVPLPEKLCENAKSAASLFLAVTPRACKFALPFIALANPAAMLTKVSEAPMLNVTAC